MRKRIRLTPHDRRSIWSRYQAGDIKVARLAAIYRVSREMFTSRAHRKTSLNRFINFYNSVKPHKGLDNMTPHALLINCF